MNRILEKIPYPIAGLMLALATLGNLLGTYHVALKVVCGILAGSIFILLALKMLLLPRTLIKAYDLMPMASMMVTFPMGIMILSTYIQPFMPLIATIIWWIASVSNVMMVVGFSIKHLKPFKLESVLASYFVTFVGVVVITATANTYNMKLLGNIMFFIGLIAYVVVLPIVSLRYMKFKEIKEPLKPLFSIFATPANLLVVGYIKGFAHQNIELLMTLWVVGILTTLISYFKIIEYIKLPFYPSFSAFTYPLVIGSLSTKVFAIKMNAVTDMDITAINLLDLIGTVQLVIAATVVIYVFVGYSKSIRASIRQ